MAHDGRNVNEFEGFNKSENPKNLPHIAVYTTAGTGSETSWAYVITDTTTARAIVPVLEGAWLDDPLAVCAMGANRIYECELDEAAVSAMNTIVVDDLAEAKTCCGDLLYMVENGKPNWNSVEQLGAALESGRSVSGPLLFESNGVSITDVAIAERAYQAALASWREVRGDPADRSVGTGRSISDDDRKAAVEGLRELARFAVTLKYDELPGQVVDRATHVLINNVACAILGTEHERLGPLDILPGLWGHGHEATLIGSSERASTPLHR